MSSQVGNMLKVRVLLFALVITSCIQWTRTDCGLLEAMCGDKCHNPFTSTCKCGSEIVNHFEREICCNYKNCSHIPGTENVYCNGQKQSANEPCKGQCIQPSGGEFLPCDDGQQCVEASSVKLLPNEPIMYACFIHLNLIIAK